MTAIMIYRHFRFLSNISISSPSFGNIFTRLRMENISVTFLVLGACPLPLLPPVTLICICLYVSHINTCVRFLRTQFHGHISSIGVRTTPFVCEEHVCCIFVLELDHVNICRVFKNYSDFEIAGVVFILLSLLPYLCVRSFFGGSVRSLPVRPRPIVYCQ